MICPTCHSESCRRSRRAGAKDRLYSLFGLRPWRCKVCEKRFYGWLVPAKYVFYVHCPSCGNLDLQLVSRDRVMEGRFTGLRRLLRFTAYRCEDCRSRFFSARRYHPIKPAHSYHRPDSPAPSSDSTPE